MTLEIDNLGVEGKRTLVMVTTIVLLVLSHASYGLRLLAKKTTSGRLQLEDWLMGGALFFSYGTAVCQFYGLTVGLGQHETNVSKENVKNLSLSVWIIQRTQPFCLLCLKSSIILLYVRLFPIRTFRRFAWGIWTYTLLWTIAALGASTFECTPVSFFWNKDQSGHCIPNALRTVSFTNGLLSFVGDLVILCMPVPMIWNLQLNLRRKIALSGIFLIGVFVLITSVIRLVALFSINSDLTFSQVEAGVWTYMEIGIGIMCGNLPLMRPLFRRFFDSTGSTNPDSRYPNAGSRGSRIMGRSDNSQLDPKNPYRAVGFERMDEESLGDGSDIELHDRRFQGEGIVVTTDVHVKEEETGGRAVTRDMADPLRDHSTGSIEAVRTGNLPSVQAGKAL